ncbi:small hydrophobic protein [Streptomyces sp. NPDC029080]|uniref:small hydrophobic protein n=1 Tax=Streptomyces sp. NPDC029080 TaxID=3155017 RepID=UPI0033DE8580
MMAGFGNGTRGYPRSRGRTWQRWGSPLVSEVERGGGPDRATLGIIGAICAVAGFFALGIVLGPVAMFCGWQSMGRRWSSDRDVSALVALILGAIDTLLAVIALAGAATWGNGLL